MSQRAAKHESREQVGHDSGFDDGKPDSGEHRVAQPRSADRERAGVQRYFDRFAEAMTSGDTKTMAKLWGVPAFVIGANEARVVQSESEVEQFFDGAKDMYNERGIFGTRAEIVDLDWVGPDLVIAKVRWPYLDQNERTVGEECSSYTLLRGEDGGFKLRVITMRGASGNGAEIECAAPAP
jgi:hypothetical protein